MVFELTQFDVKRAVLVYLIILATCTVLGLAFGFAASIAWHGLSGPRVMASTLIRGYRDLFFLSGKRIWAIAALTFKESSRRKAFWIGAPVRGAVYVRRLVPGDV